MQTILVVFHLFLAIGLIGLILIQHGKGADAGAAFGSGASATVFGAQGSASFLTRTTAILAALFFVTSMVLAYFAAQSRDTSGIMEAMQQQATATQVQEGDVPVVPESAATDVPVVQEAAEVPLEPQDTESEPVEVAVPDVVESVESTVSEAVESDSSVPAETKE